MREATATAKCKPYQHARTDVVIQRMGLLPSLHRLNVVEFVIRLVLFLGAFVETLRHGRIGLRALPEELRRVRGYHPDAFLQHVQ